jgi:polysaccharide biosynthesis transport protein
VSTEIILPTEPKSENLPARRDLSPPLRHTDEVGESDIALAEVWRIVRKRKAIIFRVAFGLLAVVLVYTFIQTPKYRSESTIEFSEENSDSLALDEQRPTGDATSVDYALMQKTQVKALLSDTLALRVIKELGLEKPPENANKHWFAAFTRKNASESGLPLEQAPYRRVKVLNAFHQNLSVAAVPGTRMISIQFMNPDPQISALAVNALVKDYKEQYFQNRYSATIEASAWLSKQLDDLRTQVASSEQRLVDYQKQAGILGTDESHNIVMTRLEEGAKQLINAQENRIVAHTIVHLVRNGDPEAVSGLISGSANSTFSTSRVALTTIQSLRLQQSEANMQYAETATHYGAANPKLMELRGRVDRIDETILQEIQNLRLRAENDYVAAQRTENALRAAFEDEKNEANQLDESAVQYTILKHEVESNRTLYDGLLKKFKEASVLGGLRGSNILVVDEALVPDRPARPNILLNLGLGLMIGLLCGVGAAFAAENLDDTISTADEAEEVSRVPALGVVPSWRVPGRREASELALQPGIRESGICVVAHSRSRPAEAFRAIRTSIIQSTRPGISTPILMTSASTGEGKSTVSLNCAAAFAQQGARVLLVKLICAAPCSTPSSI